MRLPSVCSSSISDVPSSSCRWAQSSAARGKPGSVAPPAWGSCSPHASASGQASNRAASSYRCYKSALRYVVGAPAAGLRQEWNRTLSINSPKFPTLGAKSSVSPVDLRSIVLSIVIILNKVVLCSFKNIASYPEAKKAKRNQLWALPRLERKTKTDPRLLDPSRRPHSAGAATMYSPGLPRRPSCNRR